MRSLSAIKQKHGVFEPSPGLFQAFYKLRGASEYLMIDIAVFKLSCPDKFLEPEIHGSPVFYFNKSNKVEHPALNKDEFTKKLQKRLAGLRSEFTMFHNLVQKEINRGNLLEAMDYYGMLLAWLVMALRIKYYPLHHDFKMRYIHYELPLGIIKKLKGLYFVKDVNDLQMKYNRVVEWFPKLMSEINEKKVERLIETA